MNKLYHLALIYKLYLRRNSLLSFHIAVRQVAWGIGCDRWILSYHYCFNAVGILDL